MIQREIKIRNNAGIHCRPASVILNAVNSSYPDTVFTVTADGETIELNGILSLISLGLCCGASATLTAEGKDEEKAVSEIGDLFETEFDFPPQ